MEYGKKDFKVGDLLKTKAGDIYILLRGDGDEWGVITTDANGKIPGLCNTVEFKDDGSLYIRGRAKDKGKVVVIMRFDCEPGMNRVSEALKFITKRERCYETKVVWRDDEDKAQYIDEIVKKMEHDNITLDDIMNAIQ